MGIGKLFSAVSILRNQGWGFFFSRLKNRFWGEKLPGFRTFEVFFKDKIILEVGGPSPIFQDKAALPVYSLCKRVDGCNFSSQTAWEGSISEGMSYITHSAQPGYQYISEASDLSIITSATYDGLISSNCLEHIANPLAAILEWKRVIKVGGIILLILPNATYTFDHKRPLTSFGHLLQDYSMQTSEADLSHLDEILQLHDVSRDLPAGDLQSFATRSKLNAQNRMLHHHVFNGKLLNEIMTWAGMKVMYQNSGIQHVILGQKMS